MGEGSRRRHAACWAIVAILLLACDRPSKPEPVAGGEARQAPSATPSATLATFSAPLPAGVVEAEPSSVDRYEMAEIPLTLAGFQYSNPFDPREIDVLGYFAEPPDAAAQAQVRVIPGFWDGQAWYVRFTPVRVGRYTYRVTAQDRAHPSPVVIAAGALVSRQAPANHGFLRNSQRNPYYMEFDDGTPFFGIGLNRAWYAGDPHGPNEGDWIPFAQEAAYGINYHRIWTTMWYNEDLHEPAWAALENISQPGPGWYDMQAAAQLEAALDEARAAGVYVQLVLYVHTNFSYHDPKSVSVGGKPCVYEGNCDYNDIAHAKRPDGSDLALHWFANWSANPYNVANGGPLTRRAYFFTDAEAHRLTRQKLRYFIARWGAYTNIAAWELWNEFQYGFWPDFDCGQSRIEAPPGFPPDPREWLRRWHQEMAAYLREHDTYGHLVTTSDPTHPCYHWEAERWLDNINYHSYEEKDPKRVAGEIARRNLELRRFGKPVIPGEFGTSSDEDWPEHTHNGMWASALSGGATTALKWNDGDKPDPRVEDWDELCLTAECMPDGHDHGPSILPEIRVLASFLADARFAASGYAPTGSTVSAPDQLSLAMLDGAAPAGNRGLAWMQNQGRGRVEGAWLTIEGFAPGAYTLSWIDDYTGAVLALSQVEVPGDSRLVAAVPGYDRSIAVRITKSASRSVG